MTDINVAGTILVVDDDEAVREVVCLGLEDAGYRVLGAEDAACALAIVREGVQLDLAVVDYSMPVMNGADLIRQLWARNPHLPVLCVTGYAGGADLKALLTHEQILQKPFKRADLLARIGQLAPKLMQHCALVGA
jgi:CheY-like chemotaxis protein